MAERKRLGIVFAYDETWVAGAYYILNLVYALQTLPDQERPVIILLCRSYKEFNMVKDTGYPYLIYFPMTPAYNRAERALNIAWRKLTGRNFIEKRIRPEQLDKLFLFKLYWEFELINNDMKVFWIPDFQERNLPGFYSRQEVIYRERATTQTVNTQSKLLFSSNNAASDFLKYYPDANNKTAVVPFAVSFPDFSSLSIDELRLKYDLPAVYFMTPNQFWVHKNHKILLEAAALLKQQGTSFCLVLTGNEKDFRAPDYANELKLFVKQHNMENEVRFLGFIDRREQLCLLKNSFVVIQPSLFEGWSTVVEDAKALNCFVLLSDIPVHREQLKENVLFFNPSDAEDLQAKMFSLINEKPLMVAVNYSENIRQFGKNFMQAIWS